jgi:hypothetical protein
VDQLDVLGHQLLQLHTRPPAALDPRGTWPLWHVSAHRAISQRDHAQASQYRAHLSSHGHVVGRPPGFRWPHIALRCEWHGCATSPAVRWRMQSEDITGSHLSGHHCEVSAWRIGKCREGAHRSPPVSKIWGLRHFGAVVISQQSRQPVVILELHSEEICALPTGDGKRLSQIYTEGVQHTGCCWEW